MKQLCFIILIALSVSQSCFAQSLVSSVDRHTINEDETLNLTITLDDATFSGDPDLAGLDSNFQILNQRSGSSTTIINGSYSSKKEWHFTLLPKKTGKLLIPSFKLKKLFSDAIEIDVLPAGTSSNNKNGANDSGSAQQGDLFLEQSIDKNEAYVQEKMILTLQIFTAINISRPEIPAPAFPDFTIEKIGQSEYQSKRNGRNYYVLEYKYALFPNKSGKVSLPRQRFQINELNNNGQRFPFNFPGFNDTATPHFLSAPEVTLTIKPQPDPLPAPYWLPSEEVTMTDNLPAQQTVDVGTPLTRTIEIKALGNLAAHIPPLPASALPGLKSYSEQPELANAHVGENLLATRKENIAFVPVQPGTYLLPAISLHWWDTKTRQFKITSLPERTLTVKGSVGISSSVTNQPPTVSPEVSAQSPVQALDSSPMLSVPGANTPTPFYMNVYLWMGMAAIFVVLWIVTLVLMLNKKNNSASISLSASEAARQQSIKEKFKQLKMVSKNNDAKSSRRLLIDWAQAQWPEAGILTLQQIKQQLGNDVFSKLADELDDCLYRGSVQWNGKALLDFLESAKFNVAANSLATLPKLYE